MISFAVSVGVLLYVHFVKKPDGSTMLVNQTAGAEAAQNEA